MNALTFTPTEGFRPALGLGSPHAQTVFGAYFRASRFPPMQRERWTTPDGDFVDVDVLDGARHAPTVLVLHGMEGSSRAGYVAELLRGIAARRWGALVLNFRSCSGEPNRHAKSYHFGAIDDPAWVLGRLRTRVDGALFAVGFSLGGNVLLHLLAAQGERSLVGRAVAVSVPFELERCTAALDSPGAPWAMAYRRTFLRTLIPKALVKAQAHPGALDAARIRAVRGVRAFDEAVTAPVHGFRDAADYYARCSASAVLGRIVRPTLLVSALDDPFCPMAVPRSGRENPAIAVLQTEHGGHVGFVAGSPWRPRFWAEAQALAFLDS